MDHDMTGVTALHRRIARLERSNRIAAGIAGALALAGLALWSTGSLQAQSGEVTTSRLVLTDAAGGTRAILSVVEGFGPSLVIYGDNGKAGAALAFPPEGPTLAMYDRSGQLRLRMAATEGTGPSLVLNDAKRRPRAQLSVIGETPGLVLLNDAGQPTWKTP